MRTHANTTGGDTHITYQTHHDRQIDVANTFLQGMIDAEYPLLVSLFGPPTECDGYKIDAEWIVRFSDGTVATIYNWKDGRNYLGDDGLDVEEITTWHVGGFTSEALHRVRDVLTGRIPRQS